MKKQTAIHLAQFLVFFSLFTQSLAAQGAAIQPAEPDTAKAVVQEPVVITGTLRRSYISQTPVKVEVFPRAYLQRNIENSLPDVLLSMNGLNVNNACGVCGTNSIQINGLEGPYTLTLIDGMPIMGALSSVYGLYGISNELIERIEVTRGASSTLYGTEAIGGIINVITRHAGEAPRVGLHYYASTHNEHNVDALVTTKFSATGKPLGHALFSFNGYHLSQRWDWNDDGFMDVPTATRLSAFTKFSLVRPEGKETNLVFKLYMEDRLGGQMAWAPENRGDTLVYGESIYTRRVEVLGRYSLPGKQDLRIDYSFNWHQQNSFYGSTPYMAMQQILFSNFIWNKPIGLRHTLLTGGTLRYQLYKDNSPATSASAEVRFIPGLFAEEEWRLTEKWKLLAGIRIDHHAVHGLVPSPRGAVQYRPTSLSNFRLNAGTGFRLVNVFTEDHAALTGSRQVVFAEKLQPERAYSLLFSYDQTIAIATSVLNLTAEAFWYHFTNKIIPDYDSDPNLIIYKNLSDPIITQGLSLSLKHTFAFPLTVELGATYQDARRSLETRTGKETRSVLFIPNWMGTWSLSYTWRKPRLTFDYVGRVTGPIALPRFDPPFERPENSPAFSIQNVQIRKDWGRGLQVYVAIKNLLNYTQPSPLIDPANPFGASFDTSYVYAPLQPFRFVLGIRYNLLSQSPS